MNLETHSNFYILHITNDYSGSQVYKNLIRELDQLGIKQTVYTPVKTKLSVYKNKINLNVKGAQIIYSNILNKNIDRIFYRLKIRKILKDIEKKIDLSNVDLIHAHTWYSDGGVAYLLSKKYKIPYVVTIRNTDLNIFYNYLIHERIFGKQILKSAKKVVLISASYKKRVMELHSLKSITDELYDKINVIPNGVDPYWIDNVTLIKNNDLKGNYNILYIGKFTSGKKVLELQKAVIKMHSEKQNIHLHLIGGDGEKQDEVLKIVEENPQVMTYHGRVYNLKELKTFYKKADIFAMPSSRETFGLVYVEAMLQGLPILYTKGEGIDGFYSENIGKKVSKDAEENEIQHAIEKMIENLNNYQIPISKILKNHDWKNIAKIYQNKIYRN